MSATMSIAASAMFVATFNQSEQRPLNWPAPFGLAHGVALGIMLLACPLVFSSMRRRRSSLAAPAAKRRRRPAQIWQITKVVTGGENRHLARQSSSASAQIVVTHARRQHRNKKGNVRLLPSIAGGKESRGLMRDASRLLLLSLARRNCHGEIAAALIARNNRALASLVRRL